MQLFLSSSIDETSTLLPHKVETQGKNLAYIGNGADLDTDTSWAENNKRALMAIGYNLHNVDLRTLQGIALKDTLMTMSAIYIEGGEGFYLMDLVRKSGLADFLPELLESGIVYIGTSSGSMIAGPSLQSCQYIENLLVDIEPEDFSCLNLVNFVIIPHVGNDDFYAAYENMYKELFQNMKNYPYPHICLRDTQAVWVEDRSIEILEV